MVLRGREGEERSLGMIQGDKFWVAGERGRRVPSFCSQVAILFCTIENKASRLNVIEKPFVHD